MSSTDVDLIRQDGSHGHCRALIRSGEAWRAKVAALCGHQPARDVTPCFGPSWEVHDDLSFPAWLAVLMGINVDVAKQIEAAVDVLVSYTGNTFVSTPQDIYQDHLVYWICAWIDENDPELVTERQVEEAIRNHLIPWALGLGGIAHQPVSGK